MFSKLFGSFGGKKVKLRLRTPSTFKWEQPKLPVTLTLHNRAAEPRTIKGILFELREKPESGNDPQRHDWTQGNSLRYDFDETFTLAAGEERTIDIEIPTSLESIAGEGELPGWLKTAGKAMDIAQKLQGGSKTYEIRASAGIEGFSTPARVVREIGSGLRIGFGT